MSDFGKPNIIIPVQAPFSIRILSIYIFQNPSLDCNRFVPNSCLQLKNRGTKNHVERDLAERAPLHQFHKNGIQPEGFERQWIFDSSSYVDCQWSLACGGEVDCIGGARPPPEYEVHHRHRNMFRKTICNNGKL